MSPALHPPERPSHTHSTKPAGFGGSGHEITFSFYNKSRSSTCLYFTLRVTLGLACHYLTNQPPFTKASRSLQEGSAKPSRSVCSRRLRGASKAPPRTLRESLRTLRRGCIYRRLHEDTLEGSRGLLSSKGPWMNCMFLLDGGCNNRAWSILYCLSPPTLLTSGNPFQPHEQFSVVAAIIVPT